MDVTIHQQGARQYWCPASNNNKTLGYTLVEILIVLAILAIVSSISTGFYRSAIYASKIDIARNLIATDMALTRSEAIQRNARVMMCKSSSGEECNKRRDMGWESGWIVFVDQDGDRNVSQAEPIIRVQPALANGTGIKYRGSGTSRYIRYKPNGMTGANGTFTFCNDASGAFAKALILFRTGRLRHSKTTSRGDPLDCSYYSAIK